MIEVPRQRRRGYRCSRCKTDAKPLKKPYISTGGRVAQGVVTLLGVFSVFACGGIGAAAEHPLVMLVGCLIGVLIMVVGAIGIRYLVQGIRKVCPECNQVIDRN